MIESDKNIVLSIIEEALNFDKQNLSATAFAGHLIEKYQITGKNQTTTSSLKVKVTENLLDREKLKTLNQDYYKTILKNVKPKDYNGQGLYTESDSNLNPSELKQLTSFIMNDDLSESRPLATKATSSKKDWNSRLEEIKKNFPSEILNIAELSNKLDKIEEKLQTENQAEQLNLEFDALAQNINKDESAPISVNSVSKIPKINKKLKSNKSKKSVRRA